MDKVEIRGRPSREIDSWAVDQALDVPARDLGVRVNAGARAYLLPCIAGHVGADAAAVVLAEAPQKSDLMTLIVDVGTNAEIIVGNADRLLAASSPTGPAFEGAQISSGQRAAPGAIERVRIDRDTLEPRFKCIGSDLWSDEPGFPEAMAGLQMPKFRPDGGLMIVHAGGGAGLFSAIIGGWVNGQTGSQPVTKEITP